MNFFFLCLKATFHIIKIRIIFNFLTFNQILQRLESQKKIFKSDIDIKKISRFIMRVNEMIPVNSCLKESVVLYTFLKSYSNDLDFFIGVKKDLNGCFLSHSWVEYQKNPLGKNENVSFKKIMRIK